MPTHRLSAAELAHLAHDPLLDDPSLSPTLLLVAEDAEGLRLLVPSSPTGPEVDLLSLALGVEAPPDCGAVAVAAAGRAWPERGAATDVVVGHALLRSGSAATCVTDATGTPVLVDEHAVGLVPDLCRRVLGMPTPPPAEQTDEHVVRVWLDRLLAAAADRPGALDHDAVLALHPAVPAGWPPPSWLALAVVAHQHAVVAPWAVLRRRVAAADGPGAALATWFDDGSFARWALAELPAPGDALAALGELLPPALHHQVQATVALTAELARDDELAAELDELWPARLDEHELAHVVERWPHADGGGA